MAEDYLKDLKSRDIDNLEHRLRENTTRHLFGTMAEAMKFTHVAVFKTLMRLGLSLPKLKFDDKKIDDVLKEKNIRIEHRPYNDSAKDQWRAGVYIYKDGEIVEFIGKPMKTPILGPNGESIMLSSTIKSLDSIGGKIIIG